MLSHQRLMDRQSRVNIPLQPWLRHQRSSPLYPLRNPAQDRQCRLQRNLPARMRFLDRIYEHTDTGHLFTRLVSNLHPPS